MVRKTSEVTAEIVKKNKKQTDAITNINVLHILHNTNRDLKALSTVERHNSTLKLEAWASRNCEIRYIWANQAKIQFRQVTYYANESWSWKAKSFYSKKHTLRGFNCNSLPIQSLGGPEKGEDFTGKSCFCHCSARWYMLRHQRKRMKVK